MVLLIRRLLKWVLVVQLVLIAAFGFICYGSVPLGWQPLMVTSGSMEPCLPVGSLVYVDCGVSGNEIEADDVIAFDIGGSQKSICTHRVVGKDSVQELLTTRGDANASDDAARVSYDKVIGRVVGALPLMGYALSWISEERISLICVMGALLVALHMLDCLLPKEGSSNATIKETSSGTTKNEQHLQGT